MIRKSVFLSVAILFLVSTGPALAGYAYTANKEHLGGDVSPEQAFEMMKKDPDHTFLVDCRTRAEYQFVGHPVGAYNIPLRFLSDEAGEKGYVEVANPDFGKELLARFNPESDTLIVLCRSGNRSCTACNEAVKAGFKEETVFNMMGGFEGGKNKNQDSIFYGKRWAGGWKLEGLPWTYAMDPGTMYRPDVQEKQAASAEPNRGPLLSINYHMSRWRVNRTASFIGASEMSAAGIVQNGVDARLLASMRVPERPR
jgi:rhodanese-related sulfurtransferase